MAGGGMGIGRSGRGAPAVVPSQPRFLVQFESSDAVRAAQATEVPGLDIPVANPRRRYLSVTASPTDTDSRLHNIPETELGFYVREYGARIVPEHQYALEHCLGRLAAAR